ncbi:hypothetical protein C0Q70_10866 [Pomacea canaliculata]|uniref:Uncharacterized protein n=1 Tax=Pomacea canaliculata TaxID=400727 RepID=A0A2T7P4D0_POMCA|nr:hypothetical protein C0Q70_10866 [Pomacea canaliculata]
MWNSGDNQRMAEDFTKKSPSFRPWVTTYLLFMNAAAELGSQEKFTHRALVHNNGADYTRANVNNRISR